MKECKVVGVQHINPRTRNLAHKKKKIKSLNMNSKLPLEILFYILKILYNARIICNASS